jgi:pyruvate/2-oxoacid:ferredoxin oxidoreductase beta subunit
MAKVRKIRKPVPIASYLKNQKRFRHLFETKEGTEELERLKTLADSNIEKYALIERAKDK